MLKRCMNSINHSSVNVNVADGGGGGSSYDAEAAAAAYAACIAQYKGCVLTKRTHQQNADTAKKNAEEAERNVAAYDTQIADLTGKQTSLDGVREQYSQFQTSLNEAWTGYADLNGYETLGQDMECIQQFCEGLGTLISDLEREQKTWDTYAQEQRTIQETEQTAADNMTCVNNCG